MIQIWNNIGYNDLSLNKVPPDCWIGFPDVKKASVFIKPNLVAPETPWNHFTTTHVTVIKLLINKLLINGASQIIVGDCGFKDQWDFTVKSTKYDQLTELPRTKLESLQDGKNFHQFTLVRSRKGY